MHKCIPYESSRQITIYQDAATFGQRKKPRRLARLFYMLALPIFPASHPASIVGADELNFCVRDGNRWTLIAINTNYLLLSSSEPIGSVNFIIIPRVSLLSSAFFALLKRAGDPYRIRTDVKGVRGLCLNHLTNGPLVHLHGLEPGTH